MTATFPRLLGASLLSATMLAAPGWAQSAATPQADPAPATAAEQSPVLVDDIALGAEDAPLTVVEYASFTCSHCANFHKETFPLLKQDYIDTGKVRFIQRDVYFDSVGLWAGVLARCGGPDKFYPVGGMLLDEQQDWAAASNGEELVGKMRRIGAKAGLTQEQMDACWADEAQVERLVATFQHNATQDGIDATPTFIIGGEKVANMPWDSLKAKIDEKLAEAEAAAPQTATN